MFFRDSIQDTYLIARTTQTLDLETVQVLESRQLAHLDLKAHHLARLRHGKRALDQVPTDELVLHVELDVSLEGLVDVFRFLSEHRREVCTRYAMDQAARGGYIYALEFLHQHRHEGCTHFALYWAVDRGLNQKAHWLLERYPRHLSPQVFLHAIPNAPFTADAMVQAARHGRLEVVRFLHESRPELFKTTAMADALFGDHIGVAKFLYDHKYPICPATDIAAAPQYAQDWLQDVHTL
ncbi:hypothetical protein RI367_007791 [Sorochytrium milnesiophthora]